MTGRLSLRRFPNEIVRRRQSAGDHDINGRWQPGEIVEAILPASVQPLNLADDDLAGGAQLVERLKIFCPVGLEPSGDAQPLVAAFDDREADRVLYEGNEYVVVESRTWPNRHCRATMLRES